MDNYIPADETFQEAEFPFPAPFSDCKIMKVGKNAKFNHINGYVEKYFKDDSARWVVYESVDGATDKAISCVEVFKHQSKIPIYQWTKIAYAKRVVLWKCLIEGPRDIRATIEVPVIFIVVSKDPFPADYSCLSMQCSSDQEIAFRPSSSTPNRRKSEKTPGKRNNGDGGGENKWKKPGADQRKRDARERDEVLKKIEKTTIKE